MPVARAPDPFDASSEQEVSGAPHVLLIGACRRTHAGCYPSEPAPGRDPARRDTVFSVTASWATASCARKCGDRRCAACTADGSYTSCRSPCRIVDTLTFEGSGSPIPIPDPRIYSPSYGHDWIHRARSDGPTHGEEPPEGRLPAHRAQPRRGADQRARGRRGRAWLVPCGDRASRGADHHDGSGLAG